MRKFFRILIIILEIGALLGAGFLVWRFAIQPSPTPEATIPEGGELITAKLVTTDQIFDYWINKKTNEIFYIKEDGQIYKINSNGEPENTGSKANGKLSYIKPSLDGVLMIIAFDAHQTPAFAIYNTENKSWRGLPIGTTAAAWDPQSNNRLVYLKDNGTTSRLYTLTLNNNRSVEELRLNQKGLDLDWQLSDSIYLSEKPSAEYLTSIWSYNLKTKTINTIIKEEGGLMVKWFNEGKNAIKLSEGLLNIIDQNNKFLALVNLITLPSKCAVDLETEEMFCAAPELSDVNKDMVTNLPDNYLKRQIYFNDLLYLIPLNFSELRPSEELNLSTKFPVTDLLTDADRLEINNGDIYFINRYDKKLYKIEL